MNIQEFFCCLIYMRNSPLPIGNNHAFFQPDKIDSRTFVSSSFVGIRLIRSSAFYPGKQFGFIEGFTDKIVSACFVPLIRSSISCRAVIITIGMLFVVPFARSFWHTSYPISLGIMISSNIVSGFSDLEFFSASSPSYASIASNSDAVRITRSNFTAFV